MNEYPTPRWIESLNSLGTNLKGAEALVRLDAPSLIEAATTTTGLGDFGDDGWREPFSVLLDSIEREARLNLVGRLLTRSEIVRILQNRLRIVDALAREPAIEKAPIPRPVIVTGTARSGTSILHELLAQDPRHRTPLAWEVMYSVPAPETETYETDPRIAQADREVTLWHEIAPHYKTMHENGGALPHECIFLMQHEFISAHFSGVLDIPTYAGWMATHDIQPALRFHRRQLQLLQSHHPANPWVLKAPSHLTTLPALFSVYPDARLILTHRDPTKTLASTVSLVATLRGMRCDHVDVAGLVAQYSEGIARGLESVMALRADGTLPDHQIIDLHYADLMRDPAATLTTLYEGLGEEIEAKTLQEMIAYRRAKPRGKHGTHRYALENYGVDEAWVRKRYAGYTDHYRVEPEN